MSPFRVVPLPSSDEDHPSAEFTSVAAGQRHVEINFERRADSRTRRSTLTSNPAATMTSPPVKADVCVRTYYCVCSTFAHESDGKVHHHMEDQFAHTKYRAFQGAFMQMSFIMPFGALGQAFWAALEEYWVRAVILTGIVAPMYLTYWLLVWKKENRYRNMSGTIAEKILVGMLSLQSLAIVTAEFMRPQLDYGMLVMHIAFVHNFSPLSELAIHIVTAGFGLLPYLVFKAARITALASAASAGMSSPQAVRTCYDRTSEASHLLEILMPFGILAYQCIVTMGRFMSMRIDLLSSEQLRMQRNNLKIERKTCEGLLTSMLPRQIIASLKANESIEPQLFNDVTVIFVQICDFSRLCSQFLHQPTVVVEILNILYLEFDQLSDLLNVYKVESVGDVYMAVVGCPESIVNHADVAAHFALAVQESMQHLRPHVAEITLGAGMDKMASVDGNDDVDAISLQDVIEKGMLNVRIGLNSGKLRAGVVGLECPRYKLVGDTVNTASRMESTCPPGRIQVSSSTRDRLTQGTFALEDRGQIQVKGKGMMRTFFLAGYTDGLSTDRRQVTIQHGSREQDACGEDSYDMCACESQRDQSGLFAPVLPSAIHPIELKQRWRHEFSRYGVFEHMNPGHDPSTITPVMQTDVDARFLGSNVRRIGLLFLLVHPSQKQPGWMTALRLDRLVFLEDTLQKRIASARNLTIMWLIILSSVSAIDIFLDVLEEDLPTYRWAILFRAMGNNLVGLVYLLLITNPELFRRYAQTLTLSMLGAQGVALLGNGNLIYNSDPAIIALYGAYVLFYKVCTITQRLTLCALAVLGYMVGEIWDCEHHPHENLHVLSETGRNFAFLLLFFSLMACGVRLEEHLEHVAHHEQRRVSHRLEEIQKAKAASSQLLESLLPPHVVGLVAEGVSPIAELHPDVTIMFTDIKGFTAYSSRISPQELVDLLNSMYSAFDEIIVNWALYKVEIIGDAYFVSAGCPPPANSEEDHRPDLYAVRAVEVGLALQRALAQVCEDDSLTMRVGIHSGSVVAGVVGKKGPRYHLFGASVAYAEKMESYGMPGRVHISHATHALLNDGGHEYEFERCCIEIEGEQGLQTTWLVNRSKNKAAFRMQREIIMQRRASGRQSISSSSVPPPPVASASAS